MNRRWQIAALGAVLLASAAPASWADEVHGALIDRVSPSVVSVKYVLSVQFNMRGQSMDREISGEATGVVVDAIGLVVVPGEALSPSGRGPRGMNLDLKSTPVSIRVIFPGDPKEYQCVLGATDSRLGLAFLRIKDLEGKQIQAVDRSRRGEPAVGDLLYGVSRLGQGFDYAPYCATAEVAGYVKKPRKGWYLAGRFTSVGHPLFTAEGLVVGFAVSQEGVGGDGSIPFLLPLKVTESTIERAGREAEKILQEALAGDAEEETSEETTDEE